MYGRKIWTTVINTQAPTRSLSYWYYRSTLQIMTCKNMFYLFIIVQFLLWTKGKRKINPICTGIHHGQSAVYDLFAISCYVLLDTWDPSTPFFPSEVHRRDLLNYCCCNICWGYQLFRFIWLISNSRRASVELP